jgi:hypothetical protein
MGRAIAIGLAFASWGGKLSNVVAAKGRTEILTRGLPSVQSAQFLISGRQRISVPCISSAEHHFSIENRVTELDPWSEKRAKFDGKAPPVFGPLAVEHGK